MGNVAELAKGKWRSILESIGGIDGKVLDGRHHKCPANGEGDNRFRFSNRNNDGNYFCACSDGRKDGFDLLKCCKGLEFAEAAKEIEQFLGSRTDIRPDRAPEKKSPAQIERDLKAICKGAVAGRPEVLRYLRGRGITLVPNDVFQTVTNYGLYHSGRSVPMTAMCATLRDKNGRPETLHLTYLEDGRKADIARVRILATPRRGTAGCAVRLFAIGDDGVLGVGEGIETASAATQLYNVPTWATISANGMSSFELPLDTVPVKRLLIFVDNDSNFVGQAAGYNLARRVAQKNPEIDVSIVMTGFGVLPRGRGDDFNDVLQQKGP